jgi:hypothetical protein
MTDLFNIQPIAPNLASVLLPFPQGKDSVNGTAEAHPRTKRAS